MDPVQQPVNTQPPVQPPINPPVVEQNPSHFLRNLLILSGILVFIVGVSTGVYFLDQKNSKQITTVQPSPTPTSDPTANWKTYTNQAYNFSFKYPSIFSVKEEKKSDSNLHYDLTFTTGKLIDGQPDWSGFGIFITPANGKTIAQEFENQPTGFGDSVIKVQSIPTESGADEVANLINSAQNTRVYRVGNNFFEAEHFQNNNVLPDRTDDVMKYYDQILSTFKFTQ